MLNSIICSQNRCSTTFSSVRTFIRHLRIFHSADESSDTTSGCDSIPLPIPACDREKDANTVNSNFPVDENDFLNVLQKSIAEFVLQLRCKPGVNNCLVTQIINNLKQVVEDIKSVVCSKLKQIVTDSFEIHSILDGVRWCQRHLQ